MNRPCAPPDRLSSKPAAVQDVARRFARACRAL